jgi:hypothetical protein
MRVTSLNSGKGVTRSYFRFFANAQLEVGLY